MFLKDYFPDRTYTAMYLHRFIEALVCVLIFTYAGAYFLKIGLPLPLVLLFYGVEFGVRGFLSPFALVIFNRIGLIKTLGLVSLFRTLFCLGMYWSDGHLSAIFAVLFLFAIANSLYYSFADIIEAVYIQNQHRGRQYSVSLILQSLGSIIGFIAGGAILSHFSFLGIVILVFCGTTIGQLALVGIAHRMPYTKGQNQADIFRYFAGAEFREYLPLFFGEQMMIIANAVIVPLFIYTMVGEVDTFGGIMSLSFVLEAVISVAVGRWIDKRGQSATFSLAAFANVASSLAYMFCARTPLSATLVESFNKLAINTFYNGYATGVQQLICDKRHPVLLYCTCWQMALCFGELLVLPALALIAFYFGSAVFYVGFALNIIGCVTVMFVMGKQRPFLTKESALATDDEFPQVAAD